MPTSTAAALRSKSDAAFTNLSRQLQGMDPHLDRADAAGQWTTREVLSHLLGPSGADFVSLLKTFSTTNFPVVDINPGETHLDATRKTMTLRDLADQIDSRRRGVLDYVDNLTESDLERKARIPLFKSVMGTDEITVPVFVGAILDYHLNDHAGQLAKIRAAAGLPKV